MEEESFRDTIERMFREYKDELKTDWTDELKLGSEGECECCGKKDVLTIHHLVPQRLLRWLHSTVARLLEKQKLEVCSRCHGILHPENIWKNNLIGLESKFKEEAKKLDQKTNLKLEAKDLEVSKAKQDYNNLLVKYNNLSNLNEAKEKQVKELKEKIRIFDDRLKNKQREIEEANAKISEAEINAEAAAVLWGALLVERKQYTKKYKEEIVLPAIEEGLKVLDTRENLSQRDLKFIAKKIGISTSKIINYDESELNREMERLMELNEKTINETLEEMKKKENN